VECYDQNVRREIDVILPGCFERYEGASASVGALLLYVCLGWQSGEKRHAVKSTHFIVEMLDGNLVVSLPNGGFKATYYKPAYKPAGRPHLILRERIKTDDHELLGVAKARELRWSV
jgi:hypothetical protein